MFAWRGRISGFRGQLFTVPWTKRCLKRMPPFSGGTAAHRVGSWRWRTEYGFFSTPVGSIRPNISTTPLGIDAWTNEKGKEKGGIVCVLSAPPEPEMNIAL